MRALIFNGPDQLEWQERADPALSGEDEAIVRPLAVATCDLDDADRRRQVAVSRPVRARPRGRRGGGRGRRRRDHGRTRRPCRGPVPDQLRRLWGVPAGAQRQLRDGAVRLQLRLRLRPRGDALGRLPRRPRARAVRRRDVDRCPRRAGARDRGRRLGQHHRRLPHRRPAAGGPARCSRARGRRRAARLDRPLCRRAGARARQRARGLRRCRRPPARDRGGLRRRDARRDPRPARRPLRDHRRRLRRPARARARARQPRPRRRLHLDRHLLRSRGAAALPAAVHVRPDDDVRHRPRPRSPRRTAGARTARRRPLRSRAGDDAASCRSTTRSMR